MNTKKLLARNKRARRNFALKLVLERRFIPELNRYFNNVRKTVIRAFLEGNQILPGSFFNMATERLLRRQYTRVGKTFSDEMRLFINKGILLDRLETKQTEDEQRIEDVVSASLTVFITKSARGRSALIDNTTDADIRASFDESNMKLVDEGLPLSSEAVAIGASSILKEKFDSRINTISLTETQFMAESTKEIEAAVASRDGNVNPLSEVVGTITGAFFASKEWATILDQVTRSAHVAADGQKRPINDPFLVGGELLKRPGDPNGSAGNIINCRCSALYSI